MNSIAGKVIVVTGGGQGLGAAICTTLAAAQAIVIPVDVNGEKARAVAEKIETNGGRSKSFEINVADEKNVEHVLNQIIKQHQRIDAIINNAGIDCTLSVEEISYEQFHNVVAVNLLGAFHVSKTVYSHMKQNGEGHIVNIASTAAKRAWPNASAYHASKWGLLGFSHALHAEARADGIKVTAVIAGGMKTPFILDRFPEAEANLQDPKHVADTILYVLCQPAETVIPEMMVVPMKETSWP